MKVNQQQYIMGKLLFINNSTEHLPTQTMDFVIRGENWWLLTKHATFAFSAARLRLTRARNTNARPISSFCEGTGRVHSP